MKKVTREEAISFGVNHVRDLVDVQTARSLAGHYVTSLVLAVQFDRLRKKVNALRFSPDNFTSESVLNASNDLAKVSNELVVFETMGYTKKIESALNDLSARALHIMGGDELKALRAERHAASEAFHLAKKRFNEALLSTVKVEPFRIRVNVNA